MAKNVIDLKVGEKYNRLTILMDAGRRNSHRMYYCECDCGNYVTVRGSALKIGRTSSCGCYNKQLQRLNLESGRDKKRNGATENGKQTPEYEAYQKMKDRCYNKEVDRYPNYGGRGIYVCERWLQSFSNFLLDMDRKPLRELSLERINVNGNYELSNCKWGTDEEQMANKQNTVRLIVNGIEIHQAKLARLLNVNPKAIEYHRLKGKNGDEIFNYYFNKKSA